MSDNPTNTKSYERIAVFGAGAWGTALAIAAARAGRAVTLWSREPDVADAIRTRRENLTFLPGVRLPETITPTTTLANIAVAEAIFVAFPAQHLREGVRQLAPHIAHGTPLVICAKGVERGSGKLLTAVLQESAPAAEPAVLSGPSFAREVAQQKPTAVTIAATESTAHRLCATLGHGAFRPYASTDLIGVALGGAAKNVYAIGSGIVAGLGLGENARAALLTRSFAELCRLGLALGAKTETLTGLSGLGDLVLTATSLSSRNYSFGFAVGQGQKPQTLVETPRQPLAEGIDTAAALVARATRLGVELPVAETIAEILGGALAPQDAVNRLMERPLKAES